MPRRAASDEPATATEGESEHSEQDDAPGDGLKNPARALQHMMLQVFFSRPTMTDVAAKRVYAKCVNLAGGANPFLVGARACVAA